MAHSNPITISFLKREVTMLTLTTSELETAAALNNSVHLTLFGLCAGGFITCCTTTLTATLSSSFLVAGFMSATVVSAFGCAYFGEMSLVSYARAQRKLREIIRGTD